MSATAIQTRLHVSQFERAALARRVVLEEAAAVDRLANKMPQDFDAVVQLLSECQGAALVCGVGKAGWIGCKLSASFASTGTRSHFLHASEAIHGDFGRVGSDDIVLILSNSGETEEIVRVLPTLRQLKVPVVAITSNRTNTLAREADFVLDYGKTQEACPLGLAPTTSTTLMLVMGDALALVVSQLRQFTSVDFAQLHPGGSLGMQLSSVDEIMRPLTQCRVAHDTLTVREVYVRASGGVRRAGAVLLTDTDGKLTGIFTDSDLARLLENNRDSCFDLPIRETMTPSPVMVKLGSKTVDAVTLLADRNLSELPVVDAQQQPVGMIDITDVIALLPHRDCDETVSTVPYGKSASGSNQT